ncbi:cytochrome-c peroxidase [Ancylobacter defluvii]|uniref:Methylamine utilization protein n=1 Tax=Ancylobacter defluvii TaxID=1282440 RepID=A0A9W6N9Y3_9HYPH|nr:cytochrome c peroxidase [Ancylobacter defluvii]GLK83904.1 methylamine utilization protein [Ancylobacter defluvii]
MRRLCRARAAALLLGLAGAAMAGSRSADVPEAASLRALYARPPAQWPAPELEPGANFVAFGVPAPLPPPDPALARLGATLFGDPRLSASGAMSCASCHDPSHSFADPRPLWPAATAAPPRDAPSLLGVARYAGFGWEGMERSLAAQSLRPLTQRDEMANADAAVVAVRVAGLAEYRPLVAATFGEGAIDAGRLGAALAAYLGGLDAPTRFEAFLGGDYGSLGDEEIRGLHLFRTKAGCANCHSGPTLADGGAHNLGLSAFGEPREDLGRFRLTGEVQDAGRFRTPSLRHVGRTAPYMHNGLFPSLEGVVNLYARGGGEVWVRNEAEARHPLHAEAARRDTLLRPRDLDATERAALVAFLRAL